LRLTGLQGLVLARRMKKRKFNIGDLVCVKEGTEDDSMPDGRMGLIIEEVERPPGAGSDPRRKFTCIYKLWMTNGKTLTFHEMFLEKATKNEEK